MVVKFSYLTTHRLPSPFCIPTVYAINPNYVPDEDRDMRKFKIGKYAVIQPIVNVENQKEARDSLAGIAYRKVPDFRAANCGHYAGSPVIIDW